MKKKSHKEENQEPKVENESVEIAEEIAASEVDEKEIKIAELTDRLLRQQAEFDNFRRRTQKEKEDLSGYTKCLILGQFLPVIDNFERALISPDGDSFRQGVEMIYRQLWETLEKQGITKVDTKECPFDPQHHEAVMREAVDGVSEGTVIQELQAGYKLGDQVLRPAMVKVSG